MVELARLNVSMPYNTKARLVELALKDLRSLNKEIVHLIEQEHARRQQSRTPSDQGVGYAVCEPAEEEKC